MTAYAERTKTPVDPLPIKDAFAHIRTELSFAESDETEGSATESTRRIRFEWIRKAIDTAEKNLSWRPIETAPRSADKVIPVLICADGIVGEAAWHGEPDSDDANDGWWWANTHGDYHADRIIPEPTDWMSLPAPPAALSHSREDEGKC